MVNDMSDDNGPKLVPAVQNAMTIMRLLAASGQPKGTTQIAREAGLNVSSVFNILRTLTHEGVVSFDPDTKAYRIGMGLLEFATPLLGANPADLIRPMLTAIAQDHQVAIALWHITETERVVLIDRFTAPNIVQAVMSRDSRLPVFAGAVGRIYAAKRHLSKAETRKGFHSVRWQNPPDFDAYWGDVQAAGTRGYAQDRGNLFRGLDIVASVACDVAGSPRLGISSITITGQQTDDALTRVGMALATTAAEAERCIFAHPAGA